MNKILPSIITASNIFGMENFNDNNSKIDKKNDNLIIFTKKN